MRRILPLVLAALAASTPAVPLAAQGYVYRDIAWGSDPQTTTRQMEAQGFVPDEFSPDEGEVMYTDPENRGVLAFASFAGDRLVGIRIIFTGENVDELFEQSLKEWRDTFGEPDEEEEAMATWRDEGTAFSLILSETDNGFRYVAAQYTGPGYEEEIQRRMADDDEGAAYPELDERWTVALERPGVRTAFDRGTVQAVGGRVFRVWLRDDYAELQPDPEHDAELHQVEYDCGARRFRVLAGIYHLDNRVVYSDTADPPSEWVPIPPETVGEQIITAVCRAAEPR